MSTRYALSFGAVSALLAGCGASQPPGAMPQPLEIAPAHRIIHRISAASPYRVLYSFNSSGSDGEIPYAGLIDVKGRLYGTTTSGGTHDDGTVFSISRTGTEHVLYSFGSSGSDGALPYAGLIHLNGMLYGTTYRGGTYGKYGDGTVFEITTSGNEHVLHSFGSSSDGLAPSASLIVVRGTLYGTTRYGGKYSYGDGTVFSINMAGVERVLYSFGGPSSEGSYPNAGLIKVDGTLYGTTTGYAESSLYSYAFGATVFSIRTTGKGERVLYSFNSNGYEGNSPYASPIDVNGTLYGTTAFGGAHLRGTVYSVSRVGNRWRLLYSFGSGSDGIAPYASLIDVNGTLYGTTADGGKHRSGTIFNISTSGTEHVLYSFGSAAHDGADPYASLIDVNGTLYGTTFWGGKYGRGTVFALRL
jgi:uncharacterized repeat protein (TIGR03803 family)